MRKVWIIDDDEEMSRAIGLMLKMLDCESTPFFSARSAARSLLNGKSPDLFILDINMPEVSGLDMIEFLRRRPELKNAPIVMLSSEAADTMVDKAIELGADFICDEACHHRRTREGHDSFFSKTSACIS